MAAGSSFYARSDFELILRWPAESIQAACLLCMWPKSQISCVSLELGGDDPGAGDVTGCRTGGHPQINGFELTSAVCPSQHRLSFQAGWGAFVSVSARALYPPRPQTAFTSSSRPRTLSGASRYQSAELLGQAALGEEQGGMTLGGGRLKKGRAGIREGSD